MNLALPLVVTFLLILPGIFFNYFRQTHPEKRRPFKINSFLNEIAKGFIFAIFVHSVFALWISIMNLELGLIAKLGPILDMSLTYMGFPDVNYRALVLILAGAQNYVGTSDSVLSSIYDYPYHVIAYFFLVNISGILMGCTLFKLIRSYNLDHKFSFLKFDSEWFYIMNGEAVIHDKKDIRSHKKDVKLIIVSILIDEGSSCYLYKGILKDYILDDDGFLYELSLKETRKYKTGANGFLRKSDRGYHESGYDFVSGDDGESIYGDLFVFKYENVKSILIDYNSADIFYESEIGEDELEKEVKGAKTFIDLDERTK